MYTIKWRNRGLFHFHILVDKVRPNDIDTIIWAELLDQQKYPVLNNIVRKKMILGRCGCLNPKTLCMKNVKVPKHFP